MVLKIPERFVNSHWCILHSLYYSRPCLERPPHWPHKCGLSRQVIFGDRFNYIDMPDLLPVIAGLSRQPVSHGSGLSRQVSL